MASKCPCNWSNFKIVLWVCTSAITPSCMASLRSPEPIHSLHFDSQLLESFVGTQLNNSTAQSLSQKDKQRSTKHYTETKDRATRTPLKTGGCICYQETKTEKRVFCEMCFIYSLMSIKKNFILTEVFAMFYFISL